MRLPHLISLLLILCSFTVTWADTSSGKHYALRLKPGQDLKIELTRFLEENQLKACAVVTCVGSLTRANLRFANEPSGSLIDGPLEIVSLVGCGGKGAWHLHLSVSDQKGKMTGGHLLDGCIVRTTAEIVLVELTDLEFDRVDDPETGFKELKVRRRPD
jgi:uncharacterized protein